MCGYSLGFVHIPMSHKLFMNFTKSKRCVEFTNCRVFLFSLYSVYLRCLAIAFKMSLNTNNLAVSPLIDLYSKTWRMSHFTFISIQKIIHSENNNFIFENKLNHSVTFFIDLLLCCKYLSLLKNSLCYLRIPKVDSALPIKKKKC